MKEEVKNYLEKTKDTIEMFVVNVMSKERVKTEKVIDRSERRIKDSMNVTGKVDWQITDPK